MTLQQIITKVLLIYQTEGFAGVIREIKAVRAETQRLKEGTAKIEAENEKLRQEIKGLKLLNNKQRYPTPPETPLF